MIHRDQDSTDQYGNPIVSMSPPKIENVACPMATEGETWTAICGVASYVQSWVTTQLQKKLDAWERRPPNRRGPLPTKESITTELLSGRASTQDMGVECYAAILRSCGYPPLTKIWYEMKITSEQLKATTTNKLSSQITKLLTPSDYRRDAALLECKKCPFWKHREVLRAGAPKYRYLHDRITEMMRTTDPKEHMLVYALNPVTCLITLMLLLEDFSELRMMYIHAEVPCKPPETNKKYCRAAFIEALESHDHHQVFISSYEILSFGCNLQECNNFIGMEEPSSFESKMQAACRVHRLGQTLPTRIEFLQDRMNASEESRVIKNEGRGMLNAGLDLSKYVEAQGSKQSA
ncbi:hypothetical protein PG994_007194 [Apiospora phragmitis]|uniref:Helicase C-terminal domain-containing protein n=1 Tax=Apiospora phragmitis TaxID=2905665 RepID=A0ABR1V064_9PEZI